MKPWKCCFGSVVLLLALYSGSVTPCTAEHLEVYALSSPVPPPSVQYILATPTPAPQISSVPDLATFVRQVAGGKPERVVGLYAPDILALEVVQQPADNPIYVSNQPGTATQFQMAADYGSLGFLAHNTASGALFYELGLGSRVTVVYGNGSVQHFGISQIRRFQAVTPRDPVSDFLDLDHHGDRRTTSEVFHEIYGQPDRLVLQTCIEAGGNYSWGIQFTIGHPLDSLPTVKIAYHEAGSQQADVSSYGDVWDAQADVYGALDVKYNPR